MLRVRGRTSRGAGPACFSDINQSKDKQQNQLMKTKVLKDLLKPKAVEKRFRK
jgi:hypothetical protein